MKKKFRGHYCKICDRYKANEKFSGKGHANHICKVCSQLPVAQRNERQRMNRIADISAYFFIPADKLKRLKKYAGDKRYPRAAQYAKDMLDEFNNRKNNYKTDYQEDDWSDWYENYLYEETLTFDRLDSDVEAMLWEDVWFMQK